MMIKYIKNDLYTLEDKGREELISAVWEASFLTIKD